MAKHLLQKQWENQQKHIGEMMHKITALEAREEERDEKITAQED